MKIQTYVKREEQGLTHHEGSCTFDGNIQQYDFVVNVLSNGKTSAKLYFTQQNVNTTIEDLLWCNDAWPASIQDVHHTITMHHFPLNEHEVMMPQPRLTDLDKIQEITSAVNMGGVENYFE